MTGTASPVGIDELRSILVACAGSNDTDELPADILHVPFEDLGYDSLALIETAATLKRDYGVVVADENLLEVDTPAELLGLINSAN